MRSSSRTIVNPPNAITEPRIEISQAATSSPTTTSTATVTECGRNRNASSCSFSPTCETTWPSAARTGSSTPSCPAVTAVIASSRRDRRREWLSTGSASTATALPDARAARRSSTAAGVSAGSAISPPFLPAPVCTSSANTPNARCSGPWCTSSPSIRSSGTFVSLLRSSPV